MRIDKDLDIQYCFGCDFFITIQCAIVNGVLFREFVQIVEHRARYDCRTVGCVAIDPRANVLFLEKTVFLHDLSSKDL